MERDETLRILAEHRDEIAAFGVKSLAIFGSVARNEARPDSDVDVLVEFGVPVGYFEFFRFQHYLEGLFMRRVDLVTPDSIKSRLKERILGEAIHAA